MVVSRSMFHVAAALGMGLLLSSFIGCSQNATIIDPMKVDYDQPTSGWGLRKLDPKDYPDMRAAWGDKTNLERAIDKSLQFLHAPSSLRFYPSNNPGDTITHDQIVATLDDLKNMIHQNITPDQFQQEVVNRYDVYTSVGYNGKGDVWFTAYFTPIYYGSETRTAEFQYPIYKRPPDLVSDPITGEVVGTYPTRRELLTSGKLKGLELFYFRKPIEPFLIQTEGSAQVILPGGRTVYVGFAGSNSRDYLGLGRQLKESGKIDPNHVSLPAVISYFDAHPGELEECMMKNDRFTFQSIYGPAEWPTGSLNVQVTTDRSLATDKSIFPRASLTFIDVPKPNENGQLAPYKGLLLDQDTGGAIRAAGRADIFMGIGEAAGRRAGDEFAQGRLYYLFLKPERIGSGSYPDLRPTPAPRGVTPGTPRGGAPAARPGTAPARPGDNEIFPGAVGR